MKYQDYPISEVRKVPYDMLWHVCYYKIDDKHPQCLPDVLTYDRVTEKEALQVIRKMERHSPSLKWV